MMTHKYKEKLHLLLSRIYTLRSVNYIQIRKYIFYDVSENYTDKIVKAAVSEGYITKNGRLKTEAYYFITKKGIDFLKQYGIMELGSSVITYPPEYNTAGEISFKPVYKNHQLALNEFVLGFNDMFGEAAYIYRDEKYVSQLIKNIRPDGVIFFNNTYYFLEMDMNTEREARLQKKWNNYRYFASTSEYGQFKYKIKVLFILDGVSSQSARKYFLWENIYKNIGDMVSDRFNVYVDTADRLFDLITEDITASEMDSIKEYVCKNGGSGAFLPTGENRYKGFTVKLFNGMETVKFISGYAGYRSAQKITTGTDVNTLIILPYENEAEKLQKILKTIPEGIFFTTKERLYNLPLYEAVFMRSGENYHYDKNWSRLIKEEGKAVI